MAYMKVIIGEYIIGVGQNQATSGGISETEYNHITELFKNKPTDQDGYQCRLRADTLEWELVELPPVEEPELSADEALDIILGGAE